MISSSSLKLFEKNDRNIHRVRNRDDSETHFRAVFGFRDPFSTSTSRVPSSDCRSRVMVDGKIQKTNRWVEEKMSWVQASIQGRLFPGMIGVGVNSYITHL